MFESIKADRERYVDYGGIFRNLGFWITLLYRFGHWLRGRNVLIRVPLRVVYLIFLLPLRSTCQVYLPCSAEIGRGLLLIHPWSIIVARDTVIGDGCSLYNEVTFGLSHKPGVPRLDNNVVVFPGARILGGIHVGEAVHVAANSVVLSDIPAEATVIGIPARVMRYTGRTHHESPAPATEGV
ncbi:MAG: hypothetical protein PQJ60_08235 [Spirochaetales bacterium]|nr:hypothetical protein [Spirochaetales bacterium]